MAKALTSVASISIGSSALKLNALSSNCESAGLPKRCLRVSLKCDNSHNDKDGLLVDRRHTLIGLGSATLGANFLNGMVFTENANAADLIQRSQRSEFQTIVKGKLFEAVSANKELIPDFVHLALSDIATYDKPTKSGGANGSIRFKEELERPENIKSKAAFEVLEKVKLDIDQDAKGGPISYADLIQFGAQTALKRSFLDAAIAKAGGDVAKGNKLYSAFGSYGQWSFFDKQFGRQDVDEADPEGRVPIWQEASVAELKSKFEKLGFKARQVAVFAAFFGDDVDSAETKLSSDPEVANYIKKYQRSKETVSQTDYEVDLITTFTKLSTLGANIDYEGYTYAIPRPKFKF